MELTKGVIMVFVYFLLLASHFGQAEIVVYDLAADWDPNNNPNEPWSFWRISSRPKVLPYIADYDPGRTLFSGPQPAFAFGDTNSGDGRHPAWLKSLGLAIPPLDVPEGRVVVRGHSGNVGGAVRWRAPGRGYIEITGGMWLAQSNNAMNIYLWKNSNRLIGAILSGGNSSQPVSIESLFNELFSSSCHRTIPVSGGDIIAIDVGPHIRSNWVGVDLTITFYDDDPPCTCTLIADLNDDCIVDVEDFAIMAEHFLISCIDTPSHDACIPKG